MSFCLRGSDPTTPYARGRNYIFHTLARPTSYLFPYANDDLVFGPKSILLSR
jgi:hypothetical protein